MEATFLKKTILFFAFPFLLLLIGCDKVSGPYKEVATASNGNRKILVEDFTGHKCVNCPRAAEAIKALQQARPGRVIAIGEHVTTVFAAPGSGIYNIDFRTAVGFSNDSLFQVSVLGLPAGMVNRIRVNGIRRIEYPKWSEYADSLLNLPALATITIENSYSPSSRIVSATIKTDFLLEATGTFKLVAYLIEDSIPHAQKDNLIPPPSNDSNYVHQHVLRGALSSTFGEIITSGQVSSTSTFTKTFARIINANWKERHCSIVAFIYDDTTKEIIQAEEKEVIY